MANLSSANAYFEERLGADAWDSASSTDKEKALGQAERELEPYRYKVTPTNFAYAVYEQALFLLEAVSTGTEAGKRAELQQQGVTQFSVQGLSESYEKTPGNVQGIAPKAQQFLNQRGVRGGRLV